MRPFDSQEIEALFNDVAPSYDRLNDLLSFGLHRIWKRQLISWLSPAEGENWVDLCCGTGDLALGLSRKVGTTGSVLGIDLASEPLALARKRSSKKPLLSINWRQGDALDTGLPCNHFDGAVMAYGLRNLSDPVAGFKELHRVLRPGARAGILDFNPVLDETIGGRFQTFYLRKIVVPIAARAGLKEHYVYLEQSLKRFPKGSSQEKLAQNAGFNEAQHRLLAFGQMGALLLKA